MMMKEIIFDPSKNTVKFDYSLGGIMSPELAGAFQRMSEEEVECLDDKEEEGKTIDLVEGKDFEVTDKKGDK